MSIEVFRASYIAFEQQLEQFKAIAHPSQNNSTPQPDLTKLRTSFASLQQDFQQIVQQSDAIDLPHPIPSYQTEISKQIRLLGMDVMYLQAARMSATADTRRSQLLDRVEMLLGYCQALLSATLPSEPAP